MSAQQLIDIKLADGASTSIVRFGTPTDPLTPVIICFSAMGVAGSYYRPLAEALATAGFPTFTTDYRGLGQSSVRARKQDFGYREIIEYDYHGVIQVITEEYPSNPKYFLGHSLGGQLGSLYLSRYQTPSVKGLILVASCSVYYRGWPGVTAYVTLFGTQLAGLLGNLLGYFPGKTLGFGGTESKTVIGDWSRQARTGQYWTKGSNFNYEEALSGLELPVLAISIEGDQYAPVAATKNLYQKYHPAATVYHHTMTAKEADHPTLNHFNWARQPSGTVSLIENWLAGHARV